MNAIHYIGFDVHKKTIAYCVKTADGQIVEEGTLQAQRMELRRWAKRRQVVWQGAMEATLFSAWIYDTLKPYAQQLSMGHPAKMKAITAGKKKSDCLDARTIADLLRCNLLPACYVLPPHLRDLRRLLRYRNLVVRQSVRMQNRMAGLLMESGAPFDRERLHRKKYFADLMKSLPGSTGMGQRSPTYESRFYGDVRVHAETVDQETALRSRPGAAARAIDEHRRSRSHHGTNMGIGSRRSTPLLLCSRCSHYCGLTAAFRSSAGKQQRGPISKQRNAWLQTALIEAAKLAPRWNPQLAALHAQQRERGHANRATLQVARKLVAYLLAVDENGRPFRCALRLRRQKQSRERENSQQLWRHPLKGKDTDGSGLLEFSQACRSIPRWSLQASQHKGEPAKENPPCSASVR